MIRKLSNSSFYIVLLVYLLFILFGAYLIFDYYKVNARLFIFLAFFAYPLIVLWEYHIERSIERREGKRETFFNIISGEESNALDGTYSLYTLVGSGIVLSLIIIFRLIFPESVDLTSTVLAALALGILIKLYRNRVNITKHVQTQNNDDDLEL